ncbi:MAG: radical SAM protein [Elusimicrobia bacterium]|nr:radical SAM protein [Elusimicrobiota bacterium]
MPENKRILFLRFSIPGSAGVFHPYNRCPPLDIGVMISLVKRRFQAHFIDCRVKKYTEKRVVKETVEIDPFLLVLSFASVDYQAALRYSREIRKRLGRVKIVCMGPHASTLPGTLVYEGSGIDYVLRGEAELDLLKLIEGLDSPEKLRDIDSLAFQGKERSEVNLIENPDELPFPEHETFPPSLYYSIYPLQVYSRLRWGYVLSSRGCPHGCIFCSPYIRNSYGSRVRFRSIDNVIGEIRHLKSLGRNIISFEDDNFTVSERRTLDLCREMKESRLGVSWVAHSGVDELTAEMMAAMKDSGCVLIKLGVESWSEKVLAELGKTRNTGEYIKKTESIFRAGKKLDLPIHALLMINTPGETPDDIAATAGMIIKSNPASIQVHYFTPYPGSRAYDAYGKEAGAVYDRHHYDSKGIRICGSLNARQIRETRKRLYRSLYLSPSFILKHLRRYFLFYLRNPGIFPELLRMLAVR